MTIGVDPLTWGARKMFLSIKESAGEEISVPENNPDDKGKMSSSSTPDPITPLGSSV